jgi:PAS domain S-box-containing protein
MTKESETHSKREADANQAALRHRLRAQWLLLTMALAILAGVFVYYGFTAHSYISNQEQSRLQTQARVIALNIENQLNATNLALTSVINDLTSLREHENIELTNRSLQALADAMPGIRTIFVLDAKGNVVASNRAELIGRNFRTRDYFATPAKDNNPSALYLSPPFKTVLGSFLINVSRVITSPDGSFNGIVTAALVPAYFQVLLNSVLYAPDMWSGINHGDGIRFMVVPEQTGQTGKDLALPGTFFTRHRESGRTESVLIGKSVSYAAERLMALHTVQPQTLRLDKALVVTCSRDNAAIYENWRTGTLKQGVAFILISGAACFGLVLLQRRQRAMASLIMRKQEERHTLDVSLRESHRLLADIYDFLPDATFVVDLEKRVIAWNRAMVEMTGVAREEMLGQGDHAYTIPFYGDRRNQLLDLIDADDEELKTRYQGVTRIGDRLFGETFCPALFNGKGAHIWAIVAPLYDSDGKRIGAIESIRDITAIKETEVNLARSNRELEQFAYVASHDLQEPLRKIAGFTELLANRYKGTFDDKAESYMAYIVDGATRMRSLINDLLDYSRVMRSTRELADTDCSAVLSWVLYDLEPAIRESNAEIICGALPVIRGDQSQLGQLFQNLIGNAIKYRGVAPPRVVINAARQREAWLFSVADNGIGIAPEFSERIFAIFQRLHTRAEYPGTGIGLAVCRKIVERHGGKIWVESAVGAGSTFFFTIPLTPNDAEQKR